MERQQLEGRSTVSLRGWQKVITQNGNWSQPLAFKAGLYACFQDKHDQSYSYLLSRQVGWISAAPLVQCYISAGSQIWTGNWVRMNPLDLSKHNMPSHLKETIDSDTCLLCVSVYLIRSWMNKKCNYETIINTMCLESRTHQHWSYMGQSCSASQYH